MRGRGEERREGEGRGGRGGSGWEGRRKGMGKGQVARCALHSAHPYQSEPMRIIRAALLQSVAGQLVQAVLRTPSRWSASLCRRDREPLEKTAVRASVRKEILTSLPLSQGQEFTQASCLARRRRAPARRHLSAWALWASFVDHSCSSSALRPTGTHQATRPAHHGQPSLL